MSSIVALTGASVDTGAGKAWTLDARWPFAWRGAGLRPAGLRAGSGASPWAMGTGGGAGTGVGTGTGAGTGAATGAIAAATTAGAGRAASVDRAGFAGLAAFVGDARRIADSAARNEYLQEVCGDDSVLRNRVSALLRVLTEDRDFQ